MADDPIGLDAGKAATAVAPRRVPFSTGLLATRTTRFAAVGVVNTLLDLMVYGGLSTIGVPFLLANFVSTSVGMSFGLVAHHHYSFQSSAPLRRSFWPFVLTTGVGLWIVQPVVIVGASLVLRHTALPADLAAIWLPKVCALAVGVVWNFTLYDLVVFGTSRRGSADPASPGR